MNILIDPIFNGLIQTLISVILISGLIFFGKTINNLFFKRYESLLFNFTIIKQSSLKNHVLKRCFGKKIGTCIEQPMPIVIKQKKLFLN